MSNEKMIENSEGGAGMGRETDMSGERKSVLFLGCSLGQMYLCAPKCASRVYKTHSIISFLQVMELSLKSQMTLPSLKARKWQGAHVTRCTDTGPFHSTTGPHSMSQDNSELHAPSAREKTNTLWISHPFSSPVILNTAKIARKMGREDGKLSISDK